jgi:polyisoprenyl-phosphate glycosyltransferase
MSSKTISLVLSLYNEEAGAKAFWDDLKQSLSTLPEWKFEILWVNDGSTDGTQHVIHQILQEPPTANITHRPIEFSRNFGHEAAIIAGIDHASGDAVICMDSDGQHPPTAIASMLKAYENGSDIVLMERLRRNDNGIVKNLFSNLFYRCINLLSAIRFEHNATDFFLVSAEVADVLRHHFRERNRFIRGFIQSIGFRTTKLPFEAPARMFGTTNYSFGKLFKLALNAIFTFSSVPLRISIFFSIVFILFTILLGGYSLYMYLFGTAPPSGYTTIVLFLSFSFSLLFFTLAILSAYFEKMIQETRSRPVYIIKKNKHDA